jgi:hypothetical protein
VFCVRVPSADELEIVWCVESRRALTVVAKVSETETKSEISVDASEATDELEDTLKSALKSVQEAVSFFIPPPPQDK